MIMMSHSQMMMMTHTQKFLGSSFFHGTDHIVLSLKNFNSRGIQLHRVLTANTINWLCIKTQTISSSTVRCHFEAQHSPVFQTMKLNTSLKLNPRSPSNFDNILEFEHFATNVNRLKEIEQAKVLKPKQSK